MSASRQTALLYERHRRRVLGLCRNRLGREADAEDALQQTFVYALRCLDRGVVPQNETAWLNMIAENVCRAWLRNAATRTRHETVADVERLPEARSGLERAHDGRELSAALAVLPLAQRRALLLREWQGLSYREVAAELATTEAAVETLLFRARRRVAAALADGRRLVDLGSALATLRRAFGALGAKGGAVAAAGCLTVAAAAVPLARTTEPHGNPAHSPVTHAAPPAATHRIRSSSAAPADPEKPGRASAATVGSRRPDQSAPRMASVAPARDAPPAAAPAKPPAADTPAPTAAPPSPPAAAPQPAPAPATGTVTPAAGSPLDDVVQTAGSVVDTATSAAATVSTALPVTPPTVPAPPPLPAPAVPPVAPALP